jgi:hypothetical protein
MLLVAVTLMTTWMVCLLLGFTLFGLAHLLCAGAIAIELFRPGRKRRPSPAAH